MARTAKALADLDLRVVDVLDASAKRLGLSQRRVAADADMSLNRVGIILRGETPPATVGELDVIARALGLRASDVVREAEAAVAREREASERSWGLAASRHDGADVERRTRAGLPAVDPEDESQADPFEED